MFFIKEAQKTTSLRLNCTTLHYLTLKLSSELKVFSIENYLEGTSVFIVFSPTYK